MAVLMLVVAPIANGPGFRFLVRKGLDKGIAAGGLEGSVTVEGTLLGGLRLRDGEIRGSGKLQLLRFDSAGVEYSLGRLLKGDPVDCIDRVTVKSPVIVFNEDAPVATKEKSRPPDFWSWTWIRRIPFEVRDLDMDSQKSGKASWQVEGLDLVTDAGGTGTITIARLQLPDGVSRTGLEARFQLNQASLEIRGPELMDDVRIDRLVLEPHPLLPAIATGRIEVFGGTIEAKTTPDREAVLELSGGRIDLGALATVLENARIPRGYISELQLTIPLGAELELKGKAGLEEIEAEGFAIDRAGAELEFAGRALKLEALDVAQGENRVTGRIEVAIPEEMGETKSWIQNLAATLEFQVPEPGRILDQFQVPVSGNVQGNVDIAFREGALDRCRGAIHCENIQYKDAGLTSLDMTFDGPRRDVVALHIEFAADAENRNRVNASGEFDLSSLQYKGSASAELGALELLRPWLAAAGKEIALAGSAGIAWTGDGQIRDKKHRGEATIRESAVRIGDGEALRAKGTLRYEPDIYEATGIELAAADLEVRGGARLEGETLRVDDVRISKGQTELARADVSLPLHIETVRSLDDLFLQDGAIEVNIRAETLSLDDLFRVFDQAERPPWNGTFSGSMSASGTLKDPAVTAELKLKALAHRAHPGIAPADLEATIAVAGGQAVLAATLRQALVQPVTISGRIPFVPQKWIEDPERWRSREISLEAVLPETNLAVLQEFFPAVTRLNGSASARIRVDGTVGDPRLSGRIAAVAERIRFRGESAPTITDLTFEVTFDGKEMRITRGTAQVAGGQVSLGGSAVFAPTLTNPQLNLSLRAGQALLMRDDDLNVRANVALALTGSWSQAMLAGTVGISESGYYREIEIQPLQLLSPTPELHASARPMSIRFAPAIEMEPFSAWKFDVRVITEDPFLIRGNLARGDVVVDLHIGGTGARLEPAGIIRLEDARATLPFSTLDVRKGELLFDQRTGFDPRISLQAESEINQFRANIFFFGTLSDPEYLLTSDPPLPSEDVATLLATGSTREQLGDAQVVAAKAIQLLLQEIRSRFQRNALSDDQQRFADNLSFDVSRTDLGTGTSDVTTVYRINPNLFLVGGINKDGDYRGVLKFVIRLR